MLKEFVSCCGIFKFSYKKSFMMNRIFFCRTNDGYTDNVNIGLFFVNIQCFSLPFFEKVEKIQQKLNACCMNR